MLMTVLLLGDLWVSWRADPWITRDLAEVEPVPVALVLGTARRTHRGRPNEFYRARLEAAAALYHQGRVRGILVSGDNGSRYYNEPQVMRKDLIELGVSDAHITLDYAGFRTLDSVVRAQKVFGLDHFLIISQSYHAERGVFIARQRGINALGFAAPDPGGIGGLKVRLREVLARAIAIWDLFSDREPKFLGKPEMVRLRDAEGVGPDAESAASAEQGADSQNAPPH
ncbi:vancomycin high temperature exclusion protein [Thiorhodovibrio winogradskyi]|uniref:Vancomycin high temperature exclusion protein n=2 Tax=Thiorhodovibrio winogradskyi TaxID=77007 RepID=A0ABZ0S8I3_9GAMM